MTSPRGALVIALAKWRALSDVQRGSVRHALACERDHECIYAVAIDLLLVAAEHPCWTCEDTGWERKGGMQSTPCPTCHRVAGQ